MKNYNDNHSKVFELTDKLAQYAIAVHKVFLKKIEEDGGSYDDALNFLNDYNSDIVDELGLLTPSIQIYKSEDEEPRSYIIYPQLYALREVNDLKYYLISPISYKSDFFNPSRIYELDAEKSKAVLDKIYKAGSGNNVAIFSKGREATEIPNDFFENIDNYFKFPDPDHSKEAYIIGKNTLNRILAGEKSLEEHNSRETLAIDAIKSVIINILKGQDNAQLEKGQIYLIDISLTPDEEDSSINHASISLKIFDKNIHDASKQETPIKLDENDYFLLGNINSLGEFPLHFKDTEKGIRLKQVLDNVGEYKNISNDPYFYDPNNDIYPIKTNICGIDMILYYKDNNKPETSPQLSSDCVKISNPLLKWLLEDKYDISTIQPPPPMPDNLKAELKNALEVSGQIDQKFNENSYIFKISL